MIVKFYDQVEDEKLKFRRDRRPQQRASGSLQA